MEWDDLEICLNRFHKGRRRILSGCNGRVLPGEILALIGQAGTGKSKLLEALAGKPSVRITGGVLRFLDGSPTPIDAWIGDTTELDAPLYEVMTLRETLEFNSRFQENCPETIRKRATELMELFGCREVADHPIESLQRSECLRGSCRIIAISKCCFDAALLVSDGRCVLWESATADGMSTTNAAG